MNEFDFLFLPLSCSKSQITINTRLIFRVIDRILLNISNYIFSVSLDYFSVPILITRGNYNAANLFVIYSTQISCEIIKRTSI